MIKILELFGGIGAPRKALINLGVEHKSILRDMEELGYTNSYQVLDARDFGIPQARERLFTISILGNSYFDFSKLRKRPMRNISEFLEKEVDEKYVVTQPSMVSRLPGQPVDPNKFGGRMLDEIKDFAYTITTKQMRVPNSGVVKLPDGRYRYLTERECWRLMGFDDEDFEAALKEHPTKEGCFNGTLYHQAGNSIVVQVLEAIFELLLSGDYAADYGVSEDGQLQLMC